MRTAPCILVAVDFSEPATAAYREAIELAAHADAELRLLHVTEQRDWQEEARTRDWLLQQQLEATQIVTLPGTPWVQIARYCDEIRPLLLVVGSHGTNGYRPLAPGSTTARLLVRSSVPLLVVPRMSALPTRH